APSCGAKLCVAPGRTASTGRTGRPGRIGRMGTRAPCPASPALPACPAYPARPSCLSCLSRPSCLPRPPLSPHALALRAARPALAIFLFPAALRHEALALVQPHLDTDLAVRGVRFGEAIVDVGAQRLEWQLPVQVPLGARDFRAVQPPGDAHLDP